ncbi:TonB-dependent receptor plug domain-containing protein [Novosphingobium sp. KACC 22771]|uniref:TonB-dependent receptor plug domain-containing protein n=1 Tax=Novosphingobium sp. KACC 22771 TaxID=3025670 RepID=UPI0023671C0F|nr:TonB-dependent receptor [Novosphingobium sp. KACC 22771]WDF73916.1 TonB-dependent receptor [Novosphingobium sp. KACC 22771]
MTHFRQALLAGVGSALAVAVSTPAWAADQDTADAIVVTGTRAQNRTKLDTVAPVDVLSLDTLTRQGSTELGASLAAVAPSIDFPRPAGTDGTDSIRPATLRGLSPDQTLVLINGVRGHTSALLNVNGSVGRGSAAVDLNTIPTLALSQVEVLRDGASAQYGSDAIAGVMNLRLREASHGGGATVSYGQYDTQFNGARSSRHISDGGTLTLGAWQGFKLGNNGGFLTVTGEYLDRGLTGRSDLDIRTTTANPASPAVVRSRIGDPKVLQGTGYVNAALPIGDTNWTAFAFGGYQFRDSTSSAFAREPGNANNVLAIYPNGFLPQIKVLSKDLTVTAGVRGQMGDWNATIKASYGRNRIDYRTQGSLNSTYGAASQTSFFDGAMIYDQALGGMDLAKLYKLGGTDLNVAWGVEVRREGYRIIAGEPASYNRAAGAPSTLTSGAQGFIGFQAGNALKTSRISNAVYLDLEAKLPSIFTLGAAVRGEHYSDFGDIATGKLSARADLAPWFALRGTVSTGFRAPSLQQQYFTSTASVLVTQGTPPTSNIVETGTFPSTNPIAVSLGGQPLRPEKSTNFSAGAVFRTGGFDLTIDGYVIKIRDQLGLSENINLSAAAQLATGVQAARFFINGLHTTTKGVDIVGHYKLRTASVGTFDLTAAANINKITVDSYPTSSTATLFARQRILTITEGTPGEKLVGTVDWSLGKVGATARASYYGNVIQPASTAAGDLSTGRKTIVDLEARYKVLPMASLSVGANNVFDIYPTQTPNSLLATNGGVAFPYYAPWGFNGRYLYAKLSLNW